MVNKTVLLVSILSVISCSCGKSDAAYIVGSDADAEQYVEKEGENNIYEKQIKEVNFILKYIPNEQMALQDIKSISGATQSVFDSVVKNYDGFLFFDLQITIDNFNEELLKYKLGDNIEVSYEERVDYYSFRMQKDIAIVMSEKDTLPCILYHYERNYGVSPKNNFMIGFKTAHLKNAVFVYNNPFLNTGTVKFALNEQGILNHPSIKIH